MKKLIGQISALFSDAENTEEPQYDPAHIGGMIVLTLFAMSALFWLLWAAFVFGGGIQAKILPCLQIILTSKTAADFGYIGYPYEMGIFSGWITNVVALSFILLVIIGIWHIFNKAAVNSAKNGRI